jgi:prepilin-type N-terminal cleavage/methylation domain-containing protein
MRTLNERNRKMNAKGFTLIEIMAVLVMIGVLAAVAVKKFNVISTTANLRLLLAGITELNSREMLVWTNQKFATGGAIDDVAVWNDLDKNLGLEYRWTVGPNAMGGTLKFESVSAALSRSPATEMTPARWARDG